MEESPLENHEIMEATPNQEEFKVLCSWYFIPITSGELPDLNSPENWIKYPSQANKLIEEAYSQQADKADIGESWISFKDMAQYNNKDNQISAFVKRQTFQQTRLSRFTGELPKIKTFNEPFGDIADFFLFLRTKASNSEIKNVKVLPKDLYDNIKNIEATSGLILDSLKKEAAIVGAEAVEDMKIITKSIVKSKVQFDFQKALISAYTCETFLYDRVNKFLRNEDWDNMDNLLPYIICFLNSIYTLNRKQIKDKVPWTKLYRGTKLSESMISQYKEGEVFSWDAFTSATTNEEVATYFGATNDTLPVLFIICHWDWMHPKADESQRNFSENGSFNDDFDNGEDEDLIYDADNYCLFDQALVTDNSIHNQNALNKHEPIQVQIDSLLKMGANEEMKNTNGEAKKQWKPDPYINGTEYGSTYQFDTKQDYVGQVFSISKYSVSPDEEEVIFVPGTIFKVMKTYKKDYLHCIELKISQRHATLIHGYEQPRFRSLLGLELFRRDIKMKKNVIGLQSLAELDMEKAVQLLLQGKDFIDSVCIDLSKMTEESMEQFLEGLSKMPKTKLLSLECSDHLYGSICDASRSLGRYLAETSIKELYVTFDKESEAGFFIEQSNGGNLFENLNILVFDIGGVEDVEEIEGEEGNIIGFQDSVFSQVADSKITELQLVCGSSVLELEPDALGELSRAKNLKKLMLNGFDISDDNVEDFILCFEELKLTYLSVSLCKQLKKSSLQKLLKSLLAPSSLIQGLFIAFRMDPIEIDGDIVAQISKDVAQSNLKVLELTMITITVKNLVRLIKRLSRTNLASLYLEVQFVDESVKKRLNYIPILENDLSEENVFLLTSLFEIIPKSKLTKFGLVRRKGVVSGRLLPKELQTEFQKMLQNNQIEDSTSQFSHRELVFAEIPIFPDNVSDAFEARFRGAEI